ncbi:putative quorum-sensing-regulated virulence factor [Mangrovibacterium sp.]|uniref:putative quorum-sensing-regulated virulence factor n=1 Tax=Mangrovibacterium sp. TaxID=1961364 RepID=UPI00356B238C
MQKLNDNSPMPFGIHKGKAMANVPDNYLIWLYKEGKCKGAVKAYIEDNADVLNLELEQS